MRIYFVVCLLYLLPGFSRQQVGAQQKSDYPESTQASIHAGATYLNARTEALDRYLSRSSRIYHRLQKRLERKEKKLLRKLARKDSILLPEGYQPGLSFPDSTGRTRHRASKITTLVDSLRAVQQFMQQQASRVAGMEKVLPDGAYTEKLNQLQERLKMQEQLKAALNNKGKQLEGLAGSKLKGVKGLQKDLYYATEQIRYWKDLSNDPDKAEEKALEYLMGTEGFIEAMPDRSRNAFAGLGNNATAADLQRLGIQTKQQVNGMLREQFGDQLADVQEQMGDALSQHLEGVNEQVNKVKSARQTVRQAKTQARNMKHRLGNIEKPVLTNPIRGIPFIKRFKTAYDIQTARSTEEQPVMLNMGASLAYQQSPKFRAGIGLSADIGLGAGWQNLKVSYEGLHLRAFADREILFGFGIQAGYERIFRPRNRPYLRREASPPANSNLLNTIFGGQQEAAYIGLIKRYRINDKWRGTFMIGYNFLWRNYTMKSPLLIRFGWEK